MVFVQLILLYFIINCSHNTVKVTDKYERKDTSNMNYNRTTINLTVFIIFTININIPSKLSNMWLTSSISQTTNISQEFKHNIGRDLLTDFKLGPKTFHKGIFHAWNWQKESIEILVKKCMIDADVQKPRNLQLYSLL